MSDFSLSDDYHPQQRKFAYADLTQGYLFIQVYGVASYRSLTIRHFVSPH